MMYEAGVTAGSQDLQEHRCAAAVLILESWQQRCVPKQDIQHGV